MKRVHTAALCLIGLSFVAGCAANVEGKAEGEDLGSVDQAVAQLTNWYRAYNSSNADHLYTTSYSEATGSGGYGYEGSVGQCYTESLIFGGTTAVYRLYRPSDGDHFYTNSLSERNSAMASAGYVSEGTSCHSLTSQPTGGCIMYRYYSYYYAKHFYTSHPGEGQYATYEGNIGYFASCNNNFWP